MDTKTREVLIAMPCWEEVDTAVRDEVNMGEDSNCNYKLLSIRNSRAVKSLKKQGRDPLI